MPYLSTSTPNTPIVATIIPSSHVLVSTETQKCCKATTATAVTAIAAIVVRVRCCCCIACLRTENVPRVSASVVVEHLSTADTAPGADVVVCLRGLVLVLGDGGSVRGVDDHDHALLAVLGLRAVDVHGLIVGDGHHEHGGVARLAVVVAVAAVASVSATVAVGVSVGVSGNWLEVGEDGIPLGLAGRVRIG